MPDHRTFHGSPLDRFMARRGGLGSLAAATSVSMSSVEKWRRSGVPEERWDAIIRLLRARGHRVDANDLHRLNLRIWARSIERGKGNVATRRQPAFAADFMMGSENGQACR